MAAAPQSSGVKLTSWANLSATALTTATPCSIISGPMPSPANTAMLSFILLVILVVVVLLLSAVLVGSHLVAVGHEKVYVVEPVHQAELLVAVEFKVLLLAGSEVGH